MTRIDSWKSQGSYKSFKTGKPMLLNMNKNTGATELESLHKKKSMAGKMPLKNIKDFKGRRESSLNIIRKKGMSVPSGEMNTKHAFKGEEVQDDMGGNTGNKHKK